MENKKYTLFHTIYKKGQPENKPETWSFSTLNETWQAAVHYMEYESEILIEKHEHIDFLTTILKPTYIELCCASPSLDNDTLHETHRFQIKENF